MANHSTDPNTYQFRMETNNPPLYTIMSARAIAKDEEITVSYGKLDNSLLWFMFGFHLDNNPNNQAGIPWTFLLDYMLKDGLITPPVLATTRTP
ncbi:hypothetical protein L596_010676 [Steinernema carpocapsae]|uniref:SET domain-containing protein n=1 Tax=Steinernema carpocapsae TaxID=34508 RepID=A0A4U5PJJ9_STECR|nr:hypothetical protein L596_010676 [Steinernema carpocapsae]